MRLSCSSSHHAPCCLCSGPWLVHASNTGLGLSLACDAPTKDAPASSTVPWPHMRRPWPRSADNLHHSPLLLCRCVCCCAHHAPSVWLLMTRARPSVSLGIDTTFSPLRPVDLMQRQPSTTPRLGRVASISPCSRGTRRPYPFGRCLGEAAVISGKPSKTAN